jgi:hypothetical protein
MPLKTSKGICLLAVAAFSLAVQPAIAASHARKNTAGKKIAASSASLLSGSLDIGGKAVTLPGVLVAAGSAPPAYSSTKISPSLHQTVTLPDGASLHLSVGAAVDAANSLGEGDGEVASTAGSSIYAPSVTISDPLISGTVSVSATQIVSAAGFVKPNSGAPRADGDTSITGLKIDLSLLGLGTFNYTGTPKPNTVLYKAKNGSVVIYLNRQSTTTGTALDRPDASAPTSITVDAVDIHLTDAKVATKSVSGDIRIAVSYAD